MIRSDSITIDGERYTVSQLGSREGRRVLVKLTRILGPSIGRLVGSADGRTSLAIADSIADFAAGVNDADLEDLCRTFGQCTEVEVGGRPQLLDLDMQELHFAGRYKALFSWLGFCLKVNYADFFDSVGGLGDKLAPGLAALRRASGSLSPTKSGTSGSSGESSPPSASPPL